MRIVLIVVFMVLIICGCSSIKEGKVVNKYVEPERTYIYMMPNYIRTGTSFIVTYTPVPMYDDEDYCIVVKDKNSEEATFYVSWEVFYNTSIGDYFRVDDKSLSANEDEKINIREQ